MIPSSIVFVLIGLIIYLLLKFHFKQYTSQPPTNVPHFKGWPIVGHLFSIHELMCDYLFKAGKKCGDIFQFKLGGRTIIVFGSNAMLNNTFKEMGTAFSGRWQHIGIKTIARNLGVIFKDGEFWSIHRGFILRTLKDFGLERERSKEIVHDECKILLKYIESNCGKSLNVKEIFPLHTINVISKLIMSKRFEKDEHSFKTLIPIIEDISQNNSLFITIIMMFPIFDYFPKFSLFLLKCFGVEQQFEQLHNFVREKIDEHKSRFNIQNEGDDLIDRFLKQAYLLDQQNVTNHTFTEWQLIRITVELISAGYETTSTTLSWCLMIMAKYQDVQTRVHQEIDQVFGSDKMLSMENRTSLKYIRAVIDEIYRFSSAVPMALPHRILENKIIDGYFLAKDSLVFPNLFACHRDAKIWERPFTFYPEHFLTKSENGETVYNRREELIPFGIGKRQCLGENLAQMEVFVFFANIFQKYRVSFENEISDETFAKLTSGTPGMIRAPLKIGIVFKKR